MEISPTCPFCQSTESRRVFWLTDTLRNRWSLQTCSDCALRYLSPRPDADTLEKAYDVSYYGSGKSKYNPLIEKVLDRFRLIRARRVVRLMGYHGSLLDIGCGDGRFLQQARSLADIKIYGTEVGDRARKRAAEVQDMQLLDIDICSMDSHHSTYGAITAYHVFEHLIDPKAFFDNVAQLSKPGTIVEVSYPNIQSLQAKIFKSNWLHLDPPRHLHHMPPKMFVEQMGQRNFKLIGMNTLSFEQNPFGFAQSLLNIVLKSRDVLFERMKGNKQYAINHGFVSLLIQRFVAMLLFPLGMLGDLILWPFRAGATVRMTFRMR